MGNHAASLCSGGACPAVDMCDGDGLGVTGTSDPAGAAFQETLTDLSEADRLLLSFCSSANLAAVRWLLALGASAGASDSNGSTCLHVACRAGSLAVVRELVGRGSPLDAADAAGWTPMHVACFVGRLRVGLCLMQSGAEITPRNLGGLMPIELCNDVRLREAIVSCAVHRRLHGPGAHWEYKPEGEMGEDIQVKSCLRFEPGFARRKPVFKESDRTAMLELGIEIFSQQPGQGLAFLVAVGIIEDSPAHISAFMLEHDMNPVQVGEFLGENCSLSQAVRLKYINTIALWGTGVVACLEKVFEAFRIPSDLQKIDRLVEGIAQIWWTQHEKKRRLISKFGLHEGDASETEGPWLMHQLASHDALHQLMLSTVLLHQNLHAPLPPSQPISLSQWQDMNAEPAESNNCPVSVNRARTEAMSHTHSLIYNQIRHNFFPQLQFWSSRFGSVDARRASNKAANELLREDLTESPSFRNSIGGWAELVGGSCPTSPGSSGRITHRHLRSLLSEAASPTMSLASPTSARCSRPLDAAFSACDVPTSSGDRRPEQARCHGPAEVSLQHAGQAAGAGCLTATRGCGRQRVWLSLQCRALFLASKPCHWTRYAFVHLSSELSMSVDEGAFTLTLVMGRPRRRRARSGGGGEAAERSPQGPPGTCLRGEGARLQLIFLLPDGRWQVIGTPRLQIRLPDLPSLRLWRQRLEEGCRSEMQETL